MKISGYHYLVLAGVSVISGLVGAKAYSKFNPNTQIVSMSVRTLIEEERDALLLAGTDPALSSARIALVSHEIERNLSNLEAGGVVVLVKEAVLAGDVPDITQHIRQNLAVLPRTAGEVRTNGRQNGVADPDESEPVTPYLTPDDMLKKLQGEVSG